jgi:hypothetical protein
MALSNHPFHQHVSRFLSKNHAIVRQLRVSEIDDAFAVVTSFFDNSYLRELYGIDSNDENEHILEPQCTRNWLERAET